MIDQKEHRIIIDMPKVELHLHLEGAFTFEFLFNQMQKYGGDSEINTVDDLHNKFVFHDFEHFLELWFWKNQFFREAEDFEELAYTTMESLAKQQVIYCEVFFSPWDFCSDDLQIETITEAILSGIKSAERDFSIKCNLIADLVRDYDSHTSVERVKQVVPYRDQGVIGIGLGGSEQKYPAGLFKEAFYQANKLGFHLTAHAGEAAGPESVWEAIEQLSVERIGHGVRAIEDPALINFLKVNQIPLEVCVTSNLKTKIFSSLDLHPIKYFVDNNLNISINSDDPALFGKTITEEFILLHDQMGISFSKLRQFTINAINSSFLSKESKKEFENRILQFWKVQKV